MDNKQKVFAYIDAHRDDIVEQLKKMVAFPTINDGDCNGNEGPMQKMFAQQMRDEGFDTVVEAAYDEAGERPNVVPGTAWAEVGTQQVSADEMNRVFAEKGLNVKAVELGSQRARVEATGVGAHASMPHLGVNAAGLLMIALRELNAGGGSAQAIAAVAEKLGMEGNGASLGVAMGDEKSGELTCNMGVLRYDGQELSFHIDIRYPLCANETDLCGRIVMALSGTPIQVRRLGGHPVHHVPEEHKMVQGLLKVYHDMTGLPAKAIAIGGGTYSQTIPNTVAFGINFPGDEDPCHMPDEYVYIDKLMLSVKIMAHAIETLCR